MKMLMRTIALSIGFVFVAFAATAAPQCSPRENVLEMLKSKYNEVPVAVGVTNTGGLVEVLSTDKGETWSIIVTTPQGISCLVAAGEGWHTVEQIGMDPEV